jgi:hypothetical protein
MCCCPGLLLQVALVEQLLDEVWAGPWALTVNPDWHSNTPAAYQELVNSFEAAYSFLPIATQVGSLGQRQRQGHGRCTVITARSCSRVSVNW